jgi:hypothetical protein
MPRNFLFSPTEAKIIRGQDGEAAIRGFGIFTEEAFITLFQPAWKTGMRSA